MSRFVGVVCIHLFVIQFQLASQPDPRFSAFQGTVYDMPSDYLAIGYGSWVSYFDVLTHITLDSLAIPKTPVRAKFFPGVPYRTRYGIIFTSQVEIDERGCYEFYLESDDGSRFWIEDSLIINNDKYHPMTIERNSVMLSKGIYPVKVWYYSAYESEFGLILRAKTLPDTALCYPANSPRLVTFNANTVLFDFDSYAISAEGKSELDKICVDLNTQAFTHIRVVGYTDNVGSEEYNKTLSLRRAESIASYLKSKLTKAGITFEAQGRGALSMADAQNSDEQHLNRKAEIYIE